MRGQAQHMSMGELAFILLFCIFALFSVTAVSSKAENESSDNSIKEMQLKIDQLRQERDRLEEELEASETRRAELREEVRVRDEIITVLNEENEALRARLEQLGVELGRLGKKSNIRPVCRRSTLDRDYLFHAFMYRNRQFSLKGESERYSIRGLLSRFASEMAWAKEQDCVFRVGLSYDPDISASQLDAGLRDLEGYFYVKRSTR